MARAGAREGTAPSPPAGMSLPAEAAAAIEPAKAPPPLASGPAPDLDLVFTSQVIGWIEPCG